MYSVYLMLCKDGSIYTGIAVDVERRFLQHKSGKGGHYTKAKGAKKILYVEVCGTRSAALKREAEIKRLSRKEKLFLAGVDARKLP
ncbi:MAG: GIY-YIG nuclease family protein [bacterium]|nr:GIY-YIG nuclease family protein [bacterium]